MSSSHWLIRVLATLISPVEAPLLEANLMPTSLMTGLCTMIFTVQFVLSKVKVPMSAPCWDSHPAQGCPAINAVNLATLAEVFAPDISGLAMISTGGLVAFSNTVQVQFAPCPPGSKFIGAFWAYKSELIIMMNTAVKKITDLFIWVLLVRIDFIVWFLSWLNNSQMKAWAREFHRRRPSFSRSRWGRYLCLRLSRAHQRLRRGSM